MATATATPIAAATPIVVRKGMRATARPMSAIITVRPAKTTAEPGGRDRAGRGLLRVHAVAELVAVPGQDEQGVVDPDGQPQHQRQQRSGGGHRGQTGGGEDQRHGDARRRGSR